MSYLKAWHLINVFYMLYFTEEFVSGTSLILFDIISSSSFLRSDQGLHADTSLPTIFPLTQSRLVLPSMGSRLQASLFPHHISYS